MRAAVAGLPAGPRPAPQRQARGGAVPGVLPALAAGAGAAVPLARPGAAVGPGGKERLVCRSHAAHPSVARLVAIEEDP
jgi:hypothetical protein